ncbi:MAG: hypothetical protein KIT34_10885 [Cyanobacteria bacterium TGS_CYA1]|nr:hypothetical protein [Cyanobacteria bacterium TGS_CYA1]
MDIDLNEKPKNLSLEDAKHVAPHRPALDPTWKKCLSAFAVFFMVIVVAWLQDDGPIKEKTTPYTWPAMVFFEWVQHWSLFSPGVRDHNYHETAIITFDDGSARLYEFPNMQKLDHWERFKHEKLRKMFLDNIIWTSMGWQWAQPPVCRYLANCVSDTKNQPVAVTMIKNEIPTPKPDPDNWVELTKLPNHIYKTVTIYYPVAPDDLSASAQESTSK